MYKINFHQKLVLFFLLINTSLVINAQNFNHAEIDLDNPWLGLTAIKASYPDISGDIFFDEKENDWCLKIRNTNFYWAHGRLVQKKNIRYWKSWNPFISYYYETSPADPKYYTKELIKKLKPKNIVAERRNSEFPNYSFNKVVYQGSSKKQIIKQLREISFLNQRIWIHKRLVKAVKNVERKIYIASRKDRATRYFLRTLGHCWGFNWRVISDSGKLSNHSWGTAIDIVPVKYQQKKIYWYWEANKNDKWMLIPPEKRWAPPKRVIEAFKSEGFIWGGNWHVWDTMHFEYRPELLYISDFINSGKSKQVVKKQNTKKREPIKKEAEEFKGKGELLTIIEFAQSINAVKTISESYLKNKQNGINFFREELEAERKAMQEHDKSKEDVSVPEFKHKKNENITEDNND